MYIKQIHVVPYKHIQLLLIKDRRNKEEDIHNLARIKTAKISFSAHF